MKTRWSVLSAVLLLSACGGARSSLPDGGHPRQVCTTEYAFINVTVVDATGAPASDATVTATNATLGKSVTGKTNGQGVTTAIGETLGPGTATVKATLGSKVTETKVVNWVCDECHCSAEPNSLVLTLNP